MRFALRVSTMVCVLTASAAGAAFAGDTTQDADKGKAVYAAQKCSMCHQIGGAGNKANPLDGVGRKLSTADIHAWIATPKVMEAKTKSTKKPPMPDRYGKLAKEDMDALVAYLASLK